MPIQLTGSLDITGSLFLNGTAVTASGGGGGTVDTGSLMVTGSVTTNVLTFTKGDGSTFALTVDTGSGGGGAAFPLTGSIEALIPSGSIFEVRSEGGATSFGADIILMGNYSGSNVALTKTATNSVNNIVIGSGTNNSPNRIISSSLDGSLIIGGSSNRIEGRSQRGSIVGGFGNFIGSGSAGTTITLQNSGIFAGSSNQIRIGASNFIGGGATNTINSSSFDAIPSQNAILGGQNNIISGSDNSAILGGLRNTVRDNISSGIVAGSGSLVTGREAAAIAGRNNTVSHTGSVVVGGQLLSTSKDYEVVVPNLTISGSVVGVVNALSISSNTASLDLSTGNFYTLQLVEGTDTLIEPSNIQAGQTVNLRINTTGSATVSFPASVLQQSGSAYVPTTTDGIDVVTFISFDATSLLLSNVKNLV